MIVTGKTTKGIQVYKDITHIEYDPPGEIIDDGAGYFDQREGSLILTKGDGTNIYLDVEVAWNIMGQVHKEVI